MRVDELIRLLSEVPDYYEVRLNVTGSPVVPREIKWRSSTNGTWVEVTT